MDPGLSNIQRYSDPVVYSPGATTQVIGVAECLSAVQLSEGNRGKMPQGDKGKYTGKQKRQAEHIAGSYEDRGVSKKEAKSRAWATVNKESGGGKKSGGGRGKGGRGGKH